MREAMLTRKQVEIAKVVAGSWQYRGPGYADKSELSDGRVLTLAITDEYTALQKYISTYRDPRAAMLAEAGEKGKEEKKGPPKWKVCIAPGQRC